VLSDTLKTALVESAAHRAFVNRANMHVLLQDE
jgi:hypothetical protein